MFSFLKLSLLAGAAGAAITAPSLLTFNNQIGSSKEKIQVEDVNLGDASENQDREGLESTITLPPEQSSSSEEGVEVKLCKEVVRSDEHMGRLMACRTEKDDLAIKFNYIADLVVDTQPYEITSIKLTYNSVIAELKEQLDYSNSRLFSATKEILSGKGLIQLNKVVDKFGPQNCRVEWLGEKKIDWKVKCEVN